jgi:hypothetical protein
MYEQTSVTITPLTVTKGDNIETTLFTKLLYNNIILNCSHSRCYLSIVLIKFYYLKKMIQPRLLIIISYRISLNVK